MTVRGRYITMRGGNVIGTPPPPVLIDPDAEAFLTAAAITDPTITSAIDTLVVQLKADGIWTKMKALYPFVGGTASTHKYNLKDPQDTDAAFRLVFNGGWTHSANGALPNGTNGYADTYYNPFVEKIVNDDSHISVYSRNDLTKMFSVDIGLQAGAYHLISLKRTSNANNSYLGINTSASFVVLTNDPSTAAMYIATRLGTITTGWKNSTKIGTTTSTALTRPNANIVLSGYSLNGVLLGGWYSSRELGFSSVGDGLTDTEASDFYTAVQAFQTSLSRQV